MKANTKNKQSKVQKTLFAAIIATEISHIFCCVLPTVFSVLSLLAGLGLVGIMPLWLEELHTHIHDWEIIIILSSGLIVATGWAVHIYASKMNCHEKSNCCHAPCDPKKKTANKVLIIATALFIMNISIYAVVHKDVFGLELNQAIKGSHVH